VAVGFVAFGALGCGSSDGDFVANVEGDYTINMTKGANGCGFTDWTVGEQTQDIHFVITQDGSDITGTLQGLTALWVTLVLGSAEFNGSVSGANVHMTLYGTNSFTQDGCTYNVNAIVDARSNGNSLDGTITYTKATTNNPACASMEGCETVQEFSGSRPPPP
jgi:hypothetical protein